MHKKTKNICQGAVSGQVNKRQITDMINLGASWSNKRMVDRRVGGPMRVVDGERLGMV